MSRDHYEVYRLIPGSKTDDLRYRPYRYLQENHIKASIDNYECVFRADIQDDAEAAILEFSGEDRKKPLNSESAREHHADLQNTEAKRMQQADPAKTRSIQEHPDKPVTAKSIRTYLEHAPLSFFDDHSAPSLAKQPLGVSDVIAITREGLTSAYYVDPNKMILLPDFFHQPSSGALITVDTDNYPLNGRKGNWMTIDTVRIEDQNYFLMQSQTYGRQAPYVIVDEQGIEIAADKNGFTEEIIEKIRNFQPEIETQKIADTKPNRGKYPELEIWQQYYENGEYLRSSEISEEQNYNMIDGRANNRTQRRSVLERLQEKQSEVNTAQVAEIEPELISEEEIERK